MISTFVRKEKITGEIPPQPQFNRAAIVSELTDPSRLGIVDLQRMLWLVFAGQENLLDQWLLSDGRWGLEYQAWEWLRLPDWGRRTVIEPRAFLPDSFCGRVINNPSFARLFAQPQLGPKRFEPTFNPQTRGDHTLEFLALFDTSMAILYNTQPAKLIRKMRSDLRFSDGINRLSDKDLYLLYKKIGAAAVLLHDIAMPAGGDTLLKTYGKEPLLLGSDGQAFDEAHEVEAFLAMDQHASLKQLLAAEGLSPYFSFIFEIIAGRSDSLLGQFISPKDKGLLKLDAIAYILYDCLAFSFLQHPVLAKQEPGFPDPPLFFQKLKALDNDLVGQNLWIVGYRPAASVPLGWLNIAHSVFLDEHGNLGYADGTRLMMFLFLQTVIVLDNNQGPRMLVTEDQIQGIIRQLPLPARKSLLDPAFVLTATTSRFYERLEAMAGRPVDPYLNKFGYHQRFLVPRRVVSLSDLERIKKSHPSFRYFPNVGHLPPIETPTTRQGRMGPFSQLFPQMAASLTTISTSFQDCWVVMVDLKEAEGDLPLMRFLSCLPSPSALQLISSAPGALAY
jgi:hypothetical protein